MAQYEVIVGNVGTVYSSEERAIARHHFYLYVGRSKAGGCRASGESVVLMCDGEIIQEYRGQDDHE